MGMKTRILFNAECPICNAEICHYRSYAERRGILMEFDDLNQTDLSFYGVDQEDAARRLHVFHEGKVISGVSAFAVIWAQLPRYRWLARMYAYRSFIRSALWSTTIFWQDLPFDLIVPHTKV